MIIQSKIQGRSLQIRSVGAIGVWSVALLCGSLVAACSGSIETPTEEFPPRQGGTQQTQTNSPPRQQTGATNNNNSSSNDDDDEDAPVASNEDDEAVDEDPPAGDDEDPPAGDDEDPPAGDDEDPAAAGALSFEADIQPIFNVTCGPCHAGQATAGVDIGNADIDVALESAVNSEDRVLFRLEEGTMPPNCLGGAPGDDGCISADDLEAVQAWYEAGAPE